MKLTAAANRALAQRNVTIEKVREIIARRRDDEFEIVAIKNVKFCSNLDARIRFPGGTEVWVDVPMD